MVILIPAPSLRNERALQFLHDLWTFVGKRYFERLVEEGETIQCVAGVRRLCDVGEYYECLPSQDFLQDEVNYFTVLAEKKKECIF